MRLRVEKWGCGYAVFDGKKRLSKTHSHRYLAENALDKIEAETRQSRQARNRPCLTCGTEFWSTGVGHRMCQSCRARVGGLDNRMLG